MPYYLGCPTQSNKISLRIDKIIRVTFYRSQVGLPIDRIIRLAFKAFPISGITAKFVAICHFKSNNSNINIARRKESIYRKPAPNVSKRFVVEIIGLARL